MVIVDDFGWGNAGWHREEGNKEVQTPTMNALVKEGIELDRHYVHQMCTPTRSAFQSGRLPIHVQLSLANPCNPQAGIPRNMTGIAQKLGIAGYKSHLIGKWDAGMATPTHTPKGRGYDSSLNYFSHGNWGWSEAEWGGSESHATSMPLCNAPNCAKDLWDTDKPASTINGTVYEELLFRERILDILNSHDPSTPLFITYTPKIAHYPLQAPVEYQQKFSFIEEPHRQVYAAMVNFLDDQLANITQAFKNKGMWDNTLMVLSTDNGGYVKAFDGDCEMNTPNGIACFNGEAGASNYPHRGGKYCEFEGGVRGNAFVSGGFVPASQRGTKSSHIMHIADWFSTFCALAGVDPTDHVAAASNLPPIDSLNMWPVLSGAASASPRTDILFTNTALLHGDWKLLTGKQSGASWGGMQYPNLTTANDPVYDTTLDCKDGCLFNVAQDPTEHYDMAAENPTIVAQLKQIMANLTAGIWPHPHAPDDPKCMQLAFSKYGGFLGPYQEI